MSETANLFQDLASMTRTTTPAVLQPGMVYFIEHPEHGLIQKSQPLTGSKPISFEIHSITPNEAIEADKEVTADAPKIFETHPGPKGIGSVEKFVSRDYTDPTYMNLRAEQESLRDAMVCIYGCPALKQSAPGQTIKDKAKSLQAQISAAIINWLAEKINEVLILNAVGPKDVESFLAQGSGDSPSSKSRSNQNQAKRNRRS